MNIRGISNLLSGKYLAASLALLFFAYAALCDDKPKAPAKAPAKSAPAAKPAGGGASTSKSSGPTTASHGPTTASHAATTSHPATTTSHPSTAGGGKGTTGSTFGRGTTGSTGGKSTMTRRTKPPSRPGMAARLPSGRMEKSPRCTTPSAVWTFTTTSAETAA